mgnify:CR=1 FL=1
MSKREQMLDMQLEIEGCLSSIESVLRRWGLPMSKLTLIARDPSNDKMTLVITNESQESLQEATAWALSKSLDVFGPDVPT